jgi:hypothetical protein
MFETAGNIKLIADTQSFPSGFTKREFVVTTSKDKYPQDLKFEVVKDKCSLLDNYEVGQEVQVTFDIRGNEYNGKYYVSLSCWKIQGGDGSSEPSRNASSSPSSNRTTSNAEPSMADLRNDDDFDDDPPF